MSDYRIALLKKEVANRTSESQDVAGQVRALEGALMEVAHGHQEELDVHRRRAAELEDTINILKEYIQEYDTNSNRHQRASNAIQARIREENSLNHTTAGVIGIDTALVVESHSSEDIEGIDGMSQITSSSSPKAIQSATGMTAVVSESIAVSATKNLHVTTENHSSSVNNVRNNALASTTATTTTSPGTSAFNFQTSPARQHHASDVGEIDELSESTLEAQRIGELERLLRDKSRKLNVMFEKLATLRNQIDEMAIRKESMMTSHTSLQGTANNVLKNLKYDRGELVGNTANSINSDSNSTDGYSAACHGELVTGTPSEGSSPYSYTEHDSNCYNPANSAIKSLAMVDSPFTPPHKKQGTISLQSSTEREWRQNNFNHVESCIKQSPFTPIMAAICKADSDNPEEIMAPLISSVGTPTRGKNNT